MVDGEANTDNVDEDPEEVEDIMSVGSLDKGAGGLTGPVVDVCCHCSTQKCRTKVDSDAGKPEEYKIITLDRDAGISLEYRVATFKSKANL